MAVVDKIRIIFILFTSSMVMIVVPDTVYRVDPLALLSATLRTYQRAACDSEHLTLSCPRGTTISIELAQYGRAGDLTDHSLCPPISNEDTTASGADSVLHSETEIEVKPPESCSVQGLQYILLQNVVETCQKKQRCKFASSPQNLVADPCPGIRKFVEIAYKCRPFEFRSRVACENDKLKLECNPYSRIAIYGAIFGRSEEENVAICSKNPDGNRNEPKHPSCLVSYATETVMQICHGRRRCELIADIGTFGKPCSDDISMYLKVVYTCIPRKVLKDRFETIPEPDEPQQSELDFDDDDFYDENQVYNIPEGIPQVPKGPPVLPIGFEFGDNFHHTSTSIPPLSQNDNLEENQETFYLYLIISVAAGVFLCLSLIIGRLIIQKRRIRKEANGNNTSNPNDGKYSSAQHSSTGETQIPVGFGADDISEIDGDIDLTTPLPLPNLSRNETYLTYGPTPNCTYSSIPTSQQQQAHQLQPQTHSSSSSTSMLLPSSGLIIGGNGANPIGLCRQQQTPPPPNLISGLGPMGHHSTPPPGSGTMGPMMPAAISSVSNVTPSYITGTIMVPSHHHGTLRRTLIPTSMAGVIPPNVYFDGTIPRSLTRGLSADNPQYGYYG